MHPSVPSDGNALFLSSITPLLPVAPATPVSEFPAYPGYPSRPSCLSCPSRPSCLRYKKSPATPYDITGAHYYTPSLFFNHQKSFLRNPLPQIHQH